MNDNLEQLVLDWGYNKGIFQHSDSKTQCLKFLSEAGEVADAVAVNNLPLIEDGIGDVLVTLILLAEMNHLDLERCLGTAYGVISKRTGKITNGVFVKDN